MWAVACVVLNDETNNLVVTMAEILLKSGTDSSVQHDSVSQRWQRFIRNT